MEIIQTIILAIGLSMDSLVIALASGVVIGNHLPVNILKIAGMLAFVQMAMAVAGWFVGRTFVQYIDSFDHWIAFGILIALGIKMIVEGIKETDKAPFNPLNIKVMFMLAVATSIDAMAVGLSISLLDSMIITPAIIIGVVTFVAATIGIICGSKVGQRYNLRINVIGGAILILFGLSILYEHTLGIG